MSNQDFARDLLPGERLLWSGSPMQGLRFGARDIFLVPFSLLWGGFALVWEFAVAWAILAGEMPFVEGLPFLLFGGVFVCMGLFMIVGRFFVDAWVRRSIRYGVSDQRVLVARGRRIAALSLRNRPEIVLNEGRNGIGSIQFGAASSLFNFFSAGMTAGFSMWIPSLDASVQFVHVKNPREVFNLLQRQIAAVGA